MSAGRKVPVTEAELKRRTDLCERLLTRLGRHEQDFGHGYSFKSMKACCNRCNVSIIAQLSMHVKWNVTDNVRRINFTSEPGTTHVSLQEFELAFTHVKFVVSNVAVLTDPKVRLITVTNKPTVHNLSCAMDINSKLSVSV